MPLEVSRINGTFYYIISPSCHTQLRKIHFDGCFFFQRADFIIACIYFTYIDLLFHIFIIAFIYLYLIELFEKITQENDEKCFDNVTAAREAGKSSRDYR